jgi:hypothetical protein
VKAPTAGTALGALAVFLVAGCGGGPSTVTIHGQVEPGGGALGSVGGGGLEMNYAACANDTPSPGTQVVVTDPSGKVIGTGTLGAWSHKTATASALTMYPCWMPFTIKDVPTEQRYGFSVNDVPGTIWLTKVDQLVTLVTSTSG